MSKVLTAAVVAAALLMPSQALAQSVGYTNVPSSGVSPSAPAAQTAAPAANVTATNTAETTTTTAPATTARSSGTLPFTGLDVGIVVLVGLVLLGAGLLMRRAAATRAGR